MIALTNFEGNRMARTPINSTKAATLPLALQLQIASVATENIVTTVTDVDDIDVRADRCCFHRRAPAAARPQREFHAPHRLTRVSPLPTQQKVPNPRAAY